MTALAPSVFLARRTPAAEFRALLAADAAGREAATLLAEAQAEANRLVQSARREADGIIDDARARAEAEALAISEDHETRRAARDLRQGLEAAARIEARFDALTPWLEALALRLAQRVIGTFDAEERHRLVLAEALASSRPTGDLRLRVHPADLDAAHAASRSLGASITVAADEQLAQGTCLLDCEEGQLDLSVAAQLNALCAEIALAAGQDGSTP